MQLERQTTPSPLEDSHILENEPGSGPRLREGGGDSFNVTQLASRYIIHYHALCILSKIILEDLLYIQQVFSKSLPATALGSEDSTVNTTDDNPWLCLHSGRERVNEKNKQT